MHQRVWLLPSVKVGIVHSFLRGILPLAFLLFNFYFFVTLTQSTSILGLFAFINSTVDAGNPK